MRSSALGRSCLSGAAQHLRLAVPGQRHDGGGVGYFLADIRCSEFERQSVRKLFKERVEHFTAGGTRRVERSVPFVVLQQDGRQWLGCRAAENARPLHGIVNAFFGTAVNDL